MIVATKTVDSLLKGIISPEKLMVFHTIFKESWGMLNVIKIRKKIRKNQEIK